MKKELIKTEDYLLVVDDSEIKRGDWFYVITKNIYGGNIISQSTGNGEFAWSEHILSKDTDEKGYHPSHCKKATAHLPLNDSPILEGVLLLPPLEIEDNVEELAEQQYSQQSKSYEDDLNDPFYNYPKYLKIGFVDGYNKAKESERNNLTPFKNLIALIENGLLKGIVETNLMIDQEISICKEYLNKLSQPKIPTHFEFETVCDQCLDDDSIDSCYCHHGSYKIVPKTTTNSQGQQVACGEYIY